MATKKEDLAGLMQEYLYYVFGQDPIAATQLGVHDYNYLLGEPSAAAWQDDLAARRHYLARFEAVNPNGLGADRQMDLQVTLIDLRTSLRRGEDLQIWARAPYWYAEQLGMALSAPMRALEVPAVERGAQLHARLCSLPAYLEAAQANLIAATPSLHVEMGITAAKGLAQFIQNALLGFSQDLPLSLQADLRAAVQQALAAIEAYVTFLQEFSGQAQGHFACGAEHFDYLLRHFHLLDYDHKSLYEFGLEQMATDRAALEAYAKDVAPELSWEAEIERIKDHHPQGAEFLDAYRGEMERARAHCVEKELITLPAGETAQVNWLPEYLRAGAPLGLMSTTPPFGAGLASELLITPLDPQAPADVQRQHMRDNCYAFAQSITFHEIYPGHHTQKVHHKLATASSPIRRYFSSPLFVEGWGLYTEDLMEETGFMVDPAVRLFKLRNALWRSARVVVDTGLHTRNMSFDEAVELMVRVVRLDRRMAIGEVRRYTTHHNPTYPSAYLLGKTDIQRLRTRWQAKEGELFTLKRFHDMLLSYGSPPVKLVAERMLAI
jgi:uncharacterized protein (DUF885 family)